VHRFGFYNVTWGVGDKVMERSFPAPQWSYRWVPRTLNMTLVLEETGCWDEPSVKRSGEASYAYVEFSPPCWIEFFPEEEI
jgi:hypothetical protein